MVIANLLTTSDITATRGSGPGGAAVRAARRIAAGSTVITARGPDFGIALTFFNPLPCTAGYGGTIYRNGLDTTPAAASTPPPAARARQPGHDVRGSAHAPSGGGVPTPAQPGLSQLLGLSP